MTLLEPSHLSLQVEKATTGLRNMVFNPDGRWGGAGWLTTGGSSMGGGPDTVHGVVGQKLIFTSAGTGGDLGSVVHQFTTEWMPLNEGEGVAATWIAGYTGGTSYRARFEFGDASGALVPANNQSPEAAITGASSSARNLGPYVAPAATKKVRLRFTPGTATGLEFILQKVTVARAALLATLGTNRTNIALMPSAELGPPSSWTGVNATIDRVAGGFSGSWTVRVTSGGGTAGVRVGTVGPVNPGAAYTASVYFAAATTPRLVRLTIGWTTQGGATISSSDTGWQGGESTSSYLRLSHIATAPATAYFMRLTLEWQSTAGGEVHYADAALIELGNTVRTYFDGGTTPPSGFANAWSSNGSSAQTSSTLAYVEPITWLDVIGSVSSLDAARVALDVGLLSATIRDATLDPATTTALRTGRKVRLLGNAKTVWTGEILTADVDYTRMKEPGADSVGTITMTAVDAASRLAQHPAPEGVGSVAELPHVLEGGGVPWMVLGSDDQVPTPAQVFKNDNATALDQVSVITITDRAQAYVSREGVLTITASPPSSGITLSDAVAPSYVDIKVGLSTDETVNAATIQWIGLSGADTVTETFGPYEDLNSIELHGRHHETYTIQGEDAIAVWANQTIALNKTPVVKVRSVRFRVSRVEDLPTLLAMELTHTVAIVWNGTTYTQRVQSIRHQISASLDPQRPVSWFTDLEFAVPTTVPLPTAVPTP